MKYIETLHTCSIDGHQKISHFHNTLTFNMATIEHDNLIDWKLKIISSAQNSFDQSNVDFVLHVLMHGYDNVLIDLNIQCNVLS